MTDATPATPANVDQIDWSLWRPTEIATLMFVLRGSEILLIRKRRGLGAGKINGPGGRIEGDESVAQCAVRETQEELLITPHAPVLRGRQRFHFVDGYRLTVFVFLSHSFSGTPTKTDEAIPLWTPVDSIPYEQMWADDALWIPMMLRGDVFDGRYIFADDTMVDHRFAERPDLARIGRNAPGV